MFLVYNFETFVLIMLLMRLIWQHPLMDEGMLGWQKGQDRQRQETEVEAENMERLLGMSGRYRTNDPSPPVRGQTVV